MKSQDPERNFKSTVVGQEKAPEQLSRQELRHLEKAKRLIEIAMHKKTQSVFEIGKLLIAAKDGLNHGAFLNWIDDNLAFKRRTAQLYMRIADVLSGSASHLGIFQMNTLDALAGKAVSEAARHTIIVDIASGDLQTDDAVLDRIAQLTPVRDDKAAEAKARRTLARKQVAQLTCELAGERINEFVDLLRAAGLAELATTIEEFVTKPFADKNEAELNPALEMLVDPIDLADAANSLPDFLLPATPA